MPTPSAWFRGCAGKAILEGRTARIPLRVPSIPDLPGVALRGQVHVTANGNQCFIVEVTLVVIAMPPPPRVRVVELTDPVPPLVAVEVPFLPILDVEPSPAAPSIPVAPLYEEDYRKKPPQRRKSK